MSFCVPDFELQRTGEEEEEEEEEEFVFGSLPKKPFQRRHDDELVELLWQNGQVVMQSQRSLKKPLAKQPQPPEDLFIQEDEMAAWLHYPLDYDSFDSDFPPSASSSSRITQIPEDRRLEEKLQSPVPSSSKVPTTMVDSSETPGPTAPPCSCGDAAAEPGTCEVTVTSSSGGSEDPFAKLPATDDRKRKAREAEDDDYHSEDAGLDSADTKKHARVSTSARRSRAAEVHNLSERRRRDRINEKMKALQELIPHCNKSDKASMLDEAIEYLKSLQLQVQIMSMGSCMLPMGFPGMQQYMSPMLMGMGMDAGVRHPMFPFPSVLAGSSMPTPAAANHLGPRLSMPAFYVPPVSSTDLSRAQVTSQPDTILNSIWAQSPSLLQVPNFNNPYQHHLGPHHVQVSPCPPRMSVPCQGPFGAENPAGAQPNNTKGVESLENNKSSACKDNGRVCKT